VTPASDSDLGARLLLEGVVLGDLALRTALASLIGVPASVGGLNWGLREDRHELDFYAGLAAQRDASAVFAEPPEVPVRVVPGVGPGVSDGRVELLRFESPYQAINPSVRRAYAAHEHNGLARAQHWRHEDGPRPTLCVIHGFGASPAWLNSAFFSLRDFFREGWEVLLYTLPFHGGRRGSRIALNGVELFSHGPAQFCEAIIHAVHDFRVFLSHVLAQGSPRAGVTGLSLGGYTTALLAAVEPRLDFAIPNAPVVSLPELLDGWFPANLAWRFAKRAWPKHADAAVRAFAVHGPLTYDPVVPHERLMVIGGRGDRLAPPEQARLLWEHWQRPPIHWFNGSHIIHVGRRNYLDRMRTLMGPPS
jgi:pimeloyl-ACP methyl ester carboxylesterase